MAESQQSTDSTEGLALMIGPVEGAPESYTVIDLEEDANPWETGFPDEHFDMVAVAGTLEKQPRNNVLACVREWRRILKSGGQFDIMVPNIRWASMRVVKGETNETWPGILATFYGTQEDEGEFHRVGFTLKMLRALLESNGFFTKQATLLPWEITCGEDTIVAEHAYLQAVKVGI